MSAPPATSAPTATSAPPSAEELQARADAVLSEPLYWFPVRHHSPAAARHVAAAIRARRPAVVFLEGPAEAGAMIPHVLDPKTRPPVAIYVSYRDDANVLGRNGVQSAAKDIPARFSSWYPLVAYSPEYVAIKAADEVGAEVVLMDLPSHALIRPHEERACEEESDGEDEEGENEKKDEARSDGDATPASWEALVAESGFYQRLAEAAGYRSWDEAWDALFEVGARHAGVEDYRREMAYFCAGVRATASAARMKHDGTRERERHMLRTIREELARRKLAPERAMVVCGGFHIFLDRDDEEPPPAPPAGTVYTTLAPYSYVRVSEHTGYGDANRAPAWYQRLWEKLAESAGDVGLAAETAMVEHAVAVLSRGRKDDAHEGGLSSADAIAVVQHARMLSALRGRARPVLDDVRDALVTCCVKGRPEEEGAHLLRAMSAVETGSAVGRVTPALGRLPLVHDFYAQLDALELGEVAGKDRRLKVDLDLRSERDARRAVFLHRLAHVGVPLGKLTERPPGAPGSSSLFREKWSLQWFPSVEDALIEKNLYGDSVEAAAVALLEEQLAAEAADAGGTCARLTRSVDMDLPDLVVRLEVAAGRAIDDDRRFASLAKALRELLILDRHAQHRRLRRDVIEELARRAFDRACFALPDAASVPPEEHDEVLTGLVSLADTLQGVHGVALDRALFSTSVRRALAESQSPFLQGAFAGILTEIREETADALAARVAAFARGRPEMLVQAGEVLDGILAVSRTAILTGAGPLVGAVDELFRAADWDGFKALLPRVRHAFERLHERQRLALCDRVAERYGLAAGEADGLAKLTTSAGAAAEIASIDAKVGEILAEWTL